MGKRTGGQVVDEKGSLIRTLVSSEDCLSLLEEKK